MVLFSVAFASAAACNLEVSLLNQDPYPAVPGEYVKVVFEINGVANSDCGIINFEVKDDYPFRFDPTVNRITRINSLDYVSGFRNTVFIPYRIRIDNEALDGENEITTVYYTSNVGSFIEEKFNITIEDSRTDFEVHVRDYSTIDNKIVFEILNIGEKDIEALTVEIPNQEGVEIVGSNRVIIGSVDSNEDETATFYADIEGNVIELDLIYTDQIGVRRTVQKSIEFNRENFERANQDTNGSLSTTNMVIIAIVVLAIGFFGYRWYKKKKARDMRHKHHHN